VGFVVDKAALGSGFLLVFRFPLPVIIPPISPSSKSSRAGSIGLLVSALPIALNWTPPPTFPRFEFLKKGNQDKAELA
jgi:hypothetical protein